MKSGTFSLSFFPFFVNYICKIYIFFKKVPTIPQPNGAKIHGGKPKYKRTARRQSSDCRSSGLNRQSTRETGDQHNRNDDPVSINRKNQKSILLAERLWRHGSTFVRLKSPKPFFSLISRSLAAGRKEAFLPAGDCPKAVLSTKRRFFIPLRRWFLRNRPGRKQTANRRCSRR